MSRIKDIIDLINSGVEQGLITEEERKDFLGTRISSKFDLDLLEESVVRLMHVED